MWWLISGKTSIVMDGTTILRLLGRAGAPVSYLANSERTISKHRPCGNTLKTGISGRKITPVLRGGQLFTVESGSLVSLKHHEVLNAVTESLGRNAADLTLSKIDYADGRLELDLLSPQKQVEVRRGDVVQAGLHVFHSRYGGEATQICAFIYRLICENGMTRRECVSPDGIVRTRKLPASHPRAKELLLDQVRRLTVIRTWDKLLNISSQTSGQQTERDRRRCASAASAMAATGPNLDANHERAGWTLDCNGDGPFALQRLGVSAEGAEGNQFACSKRPNESRNP